MTREKTLPGLSASGGYHAEEQLRYSYQEAVDKFGNGRYQVVIFGMSVNDILELVSRCDQSCV